MLRAGCTPTPGPTRSLRHWRILGPFETRIGAIPYRQTGLWQSAALTIVLGWTACTSPRATLRRQGSAWLAIPNSAEAPVPPSHSLVCYPDRCAAAGSAAAAAGDCGKSATCLQRANVESCSDMFYHSS
jgi:hypothetical protein